MKEKEFLYTETMADLFQKQGLYEKAGEIYRYLLVRDPNRKEISAKLEEVELHIGRPDSVVSLLAGWIRMWIGYRNLVRTRSLTASFRETRGGCEGPETMIQKSL